VSDIRRVSGVVLDDEDARLLVGALALFRNVLRRTGSRPTSKLESLHARLVAAVGVSETPPDVSVSGVLPRDGSSFGHDVLDTSAAAEILGCSQANARDLARRGVVPAVHVAGRWLLSASDVRNRATARRYQPEPAYHFGD
jgi:hypothetical protein